MVRGYQSSSSDVSARAAAGYTQSSSVPQPAELLSRWEDSLVAELFGGCLSAVLAKVKGVQHLTELEAELREERSTGWSIDSRSFFDRILLATVRREGGSLGNLSPLQYMIRVYGNATQAGRVPAPKVKGESVGPVRDRALRLAKDVLLAYIVITVSAPDIWGDAGGAGEGPSELHQMLKAQGGQGFPPGFLDDLIDHLSKPGEDGGPPETSVEDFFTPILESLLVEAGDISLGDQSAMRGVPRDSFLQILEALSTLTAKRPIARLFTSLPNWTPADVCTGGALASQTPLGILFAPEPRRADFVSTDAAVGDLVTKALTWERGRPNRQDAAAFTSVLKDHRATTDLMHRSLHQILRNLLTEPESRERVLDWLGKVADTHVVRRRYGWQTGREEADVAGEGFLTHVTMVMLLMCEPFLELDDPKSRARADKVDMDYFLGRQRFDATNDEKISASAGTGRAQAQANERGVGGNVPATAVDSWVDQRNLARIQQFEQRAAALTGAGGGASAGSAIEGAAAQAVDPATKKHGTIAEYYGLCARILHVGIIQSIGVFKQASRRVQDAMDHVKKLKAQLEDTSKPRDPRHTRQLEAGIDRMTMEAEEDQFTLLQIQSTAMDPALLALVLRFFRLQAVKILEVAGWTPGQLPPLPLPPPERLATLPAHLLEDIPEFLKWAAFTCPLDPRTWRSATQDMAPGQAADLLSLMCVFLGSVGYVRNPYLRAKLVAAMQIFIPPEDKRRGKKGASHMAGLFEGHAMAQACLAPFLVQFFVDIEFTGSHTQFYDKFNYRSQAAALLEHLWEIDAYRLSLVEFSKDPVKFVRFANMLLNDVIYHMDDALNHLAQVKEAQMLMKNTERWAAEPEDKQKEWKQKLETANSYARQSLRAARELMGMMSYMTVCITEPFMGEDMVNRTAQMLNYFLDHLVGPKSLKLKVDNMEELKWRPLEVLTTLVQVYVNLAVWPDFPRAVARDERSYRRELFEKAIVVLSRGGASLDLVNKYRELLDRVEASAAELLLETEELGDVPDDFLCPITCEIMRDPVTLPTSGQVVDRPTITRSLLSDDIDPFSRKFLTVDMLVPNVELKQRITAWIKAKRAAASGGQAADSALASPPEDSGAEETKGSHPSPSHTSLPPAPPAQPLEPISPAVIASTESWSAASPPPPPVTATFSNLVAAAHRGGAAAQAEDQDEDELQAALALSMT